MGPNLRSLFSWTAPWQNDLRCNLLEGSSKKDRDLSHMSMSQYSRPGGLLQISKKMYSNVLCIFMLTIQIQSNNWVPNFDPFINGRTMVATVSTYDSVRDDPKSRWREDLCSNHSWQLVWYKGGFFSPFLSPSNRDNYWCLSQGKHTKRCGKHMLYLVKWSTNGGCSASNC